jgi:serine acetyltransferase
MPFFFKYKERPTRVQIAHSFFKYITKDMGQACIVHTGATVDHDYTLAAGVHISPGAHLAGSVTFGECTWVGVGAAVKQGVRLGSHAVVGAGAVVVSPVSDGVCVIVCPAKPMAGKKAHRAHAMNTGATRRHKPIEKMGQFTRYLV